jgi:hypothetical protein
MVSCDIIEGHTMDTKRERTCMRRLQTIVERHPRNSDLLYEVSENNLSNDNEKVEVYCIHKERASMHIWTL